MAHISKLDFNGDPNLGLFTVPTDRFCLVGNTVMKKDRKEIKSVLGVKVVEARVANSELVGLFSAANSSGIALPVNCRESEARFFKKMELKVFVSPIKHTALGNLILVNDNGCLIPRELVRIKSELEECFGVPVKKGTVAGLSILGSCAFATNRGILAHPNCTEKEMKLLESVLGVNGDIGTVSFGSPFVGAGMVANSRGFAIPQDTTGPELQRADEALGFIEV
ncbi:MAG: translation initiation factor IF-6 [archaeon]|nr:MAG: translation initiation factor IF-6 [archaeon]